VRIWVGVDFSTVRTEKDVEAYLSRMNRAFSRVPAQDGAKDAVTFVIELGVASSEQAPRSDRGAKGPVPTPVACAMRVAPPLVVARANFGTLGENPADLMRILLAHNAKTLVHASFGLEDERVVLTSAHQLDNLDYNELEATLDEFEVTVCGELPKLMQYFKKEN